LRAKSPLAAPLSILRPERPLQSLNFCIESGHPPTLAAGDFRGLTRISHTGSVHRAQVGESSSATTPYDEKWSFLVPAAVLLVLEEDAYDFTATTTRNGIYDMI
jgi:hypothetical protein